MVWTRLILSRAGLGLADLQSFLPAPLFHDYDCMQDESRWTRVQESDGIQMCLELWTPAHSMPFPSKRSLETGWGEA